ncbi:MAG: aminopeptidase N [Pseudomonadales bacterium]|nr:aminopeptidase N [Pseudomonadales bacterium]
MKEAQPQPIYLRDYRPPAFLVDHTELEFDLYEEGAQVVSRLKLRRNPDSDNARAPLVLDGVELELRSIKIDGVEVEAERYSVEGEHLEVRDVPDVFELETQVWIKPQENTCLEGLYKSSTMFCTQCEAEGFRRITYYIDRPDVMSLFRTTIRADQSLYPVLLSNGNEVDAGALDDGRHFAVWEDPHRKPCYLFALVAGDLHCQKDAFLTSSGREVELRMYVEHRNANKCDHGLVSLKKSMAWDEEVYGREYDLDVFMIVAVDDFNMGAMENKGLNIFNSSCVLAKPETTTDSGYQRIEAIVAHEYFHNWSGNRVTCRDWFQLSLKEGFTVFRDAQFSADMGSDTVKRIEDVTVLRTAQFAEDAGPMSHPVRPASFIEISNFYTLTVYEKGAEVVRMIHTLLGAEKFRQGSDLYFSRFDGQAVTTDDFVACMEEVSGIDLAQFKRWYEQAGTPVIRVTDFYDPDTREYRLTFRQSCPATPQQTEKLPFHIPFAIGLLDASGQDIALPNGATTQVLHLTEPEQSLVFQNIEAQPVPSLLRGFSAPVRLEYNWSLEQLKFLMSHDSDGFNRWDAGQKLAIVVMQNMISDGIREVPEILIEAYRKVINDTETDQALIAKMLSLPTEQYLIELADEADVQLIHQVREITQEKLGNALREELKACFQRNIQSEAYAIDALSIAKRTLRNTALQMLLKIGDKEALQWALDQFQGASNMTDQIGALAALVHSPFENDRAQALSSFYDQWQSDNQVVEQWFSLQSGNPKTGHLQAIKALMQHAAFDIRNPNKTRSVIGVFANQNLTCFHAEDGSGYEFLADQVIQLDALNPQIASRLVTPLTRWRKYSEVRQGQMKLALQRIKSGGKLSPDLFEVVSKSLVDA